VIDDDPPHQLRGDREEVAPALPVCFALPEQFHVGFREN
jgi:hypothetical protein